MPRTRRHLLSVTTSRGVGELIRAALDTGARRIVIGCGDSGVNDGGAGLAQALGVRLLDRRMKDLPPGGEALARLHHIDLSALDPRIRDTEIEVCLNIRNMLLGRHGVSRVFGPQKGASPAQIDRLEAGLRRYADCLKVATGKSAASLPGGGASGGLGAALHLLLGARLVPRYDFIERHIPLTAHIDWADLIISAEGRIDRQTCRGKIPGEIARRAKERGKPVIVLAGAVGAGAEAGYDAGISAFVSIIDRPYNLEQAIGGTQRLLEAGTEHVMRIVAVGGLLAEAAVGPLPPVSANDRLCDMNAGMDFSDMIAKTAALLVAAGMTLWSFGIDDATAQDWPQRPVTMVVSAAAGGPIDVFGRVMAERMGRELGQQVVIENVPGAGGMMGGNRVARAAPDGYTAILATIATHAHSQTLYKNPLYNAVTDFTPVMLIAEIPLVLIARKDFPANSFEEFVTYAKANPGKLNYGSAGPGSASHLGCVLLGKAIGADIQHVPYKGTGPAMQDLQAGLLDISCEIVVTAVPQVQAGTLKALATCPRIVRRCCPTCPRRTRRDIAEHPVYSWTASSVSQGHSRPDRRENA